MQFINHTAFVFYDLAQSAFKLPDYKVFEMTSQKGAAMSASDEWDMFHPAFTKQWARIAPAKSKAVKFYHTRNWLR